MVTEWKRIVLKTTPTGCGRAVRENVRSSGRLGMKGWRDARGESTRRCSRGSPPKGGGSSSGLSSATKAALATTGATAPLALADQAQQEQAARHDWGTAIAPALSLLRSVVRAERTTTFQHCDSVDPSQLPSSELNFERGTSHRDKTRG